MFPWGYADAAASASAAPATSAAVAPPAPDVPSPRRNVLVPVLHGAGLLLLQRSAEAYLYPNPFAYTRIGQWPHAYREGFTHFPLFDIHEKAFEWDHDNWKINVIGHGFMGSELYLKARQCRFGAPLSFAFTAAATAVWEYGVEGNGTRPSLQDLVYTPIAGLVFGEGRYQLYRAAGGIASPVGRGVVRAIVDPFGEIERAAGSGC